MKILRKKTKLKIFLTAYKFIRKLFAQKCILLASTQKTDIFSNISIIYDELSKKNIKVILVFGTQYTIFSLLYFACHAAKARIIIIDAAHGPLSYISKKHLPIIIQLWHGGGQYKGIGFNSSYKNNRKDTERIERLHGYYDYAISTSDAINECYAKSFNISLQKIKALGSPRTDELFKREKNEIKNAIYKKYGIEKEKKLILYAPTFRVIEKRVYPCALNVGSFAKKMSREYTLAIRYHPTAHVYPETSIINLSSEDYINVLLASDILITDYSSIIFDFSILKRPIYLFCPDINNYERKLSTHPIELANTFVLYTEEELEHSIKNISYDYNIPTNIYQKHMAACTGNSSKNIADFIVNIYYK